MHFLANNDSGEVGEWESDSRALALRFFQLDILRLFHLGPLDCAAGISFVFGRMIPHMIHMMEVGSFANVHDWHDTRLVVVVAPVGLIVVIEQELGKLFIVISVNIRMKKII